MCELEGPGFLVRSFLVEAKQLRQVKRLVASGSVQAKKSLTMGCFSDKYNAIRLLKIKNIR
jgi:hypothetical protein